ncbi:hypothetical protein K505DRAFT_126525 [Melanomma pulvis-pyrius CBS 109.77]|uniref:Uncharacterized protein n=1 Tax=Melanomma pulvis-pyrius CBS 109.77 TaxID=1314802 RepID=A0A6A6XPS0_9PLEO|nr:hypothetical protein K505DRAFT_126525 [Melanomma pulvis-pyrius CBS 109.77]
MRFPLFLALIHNPIPRSSDTKVPHNKPTPRRYPGAPRHDPTKKKKKKKRENQCVCTKNPSHQEPSMRLLFMRFNVHTSSFNIGRRRRRRRRRKQSYIRGPTATPPSPLDPPTRHETHTRRPPHREGASPCTQHPGAYTVLERRPRAAPTTTCTGASATLVSIA